MRIISKIELGEKPGIPFGHCTRPSWMIITTSSFIRDDKEEVKKEVKKEVKEEGVVIIGKVVFFSDLVEKLRCECTKVEAEKKKNAFRFPTKI